MIETIIHPGRPRKALRQKINPLWWFLNDDEQQVPDWYRPNWTCGRRWFYWNFLRNPLQNFRCYVVGVADRSYAVAGKPPVMTVQRDDLEPPQLGYQWCVIRIGALPLPFVSYCGKRWVWQLGWQPSGICTAKLNRRCIPVR